MAIEAYRDITPRLGRNAFIHATATVIGDVVLGDAVSVWPNVVIRGDVNLIRVGARSNLQDGCLLHVSHRRPANPDGAPLIIGREVSVGHGVLLHGCEIVDQCLIGMGSLIMDKAVLEPHVLLAAGSLVPPGRRLQSGWLYMGRPAMPVRPLNEEEQAYFAYMAANYVCLAEAYRG